MTISKWIHMGTVLSQHADHYPELLGCQDKNKSFTFKQWNDRSRRIGNGLAHMGCGHGDRFAVIAFNRVEWMDMYAGCAKGGQICVPLMFRLAAPEIQYIVNDSGCKAFVVEKQFVALVDSIRDKLPVPAGNYIYLGDPGDRVPDGYVDYDAWLAAASAEEPDTVVDAEDPWTFMYTSGTTGKPKGVVRTHESYMAEYYLDVANMGLRSTDKVLMVMPMCHVNSIFYSFCYTLVTGSVCVYNESSFSPEDFLATVERFKITFVSLVPTHYIMILALPDDIKKKYDVSSVRQLLISSAPARKDTKVAILDFFTNAELWEAYGSTEAGLVTLCRPQDQLRKLGTIGQEIFGIDRIKVLDEEGNEVPDGEVGELYARTPMMFKEYWNLPEKTKEGFRGEWFSAGDMCYRDSDGFYVLVDRKANMIITGGENVFPSEVENAVGAHPAVRDVAVIGIPHEKWGESIHAVVILNDDQTPADALKEDLKKMARTKIAAYKVPKTIDFIEDDEMPRTGTGKILHRKLREKYGKWSDNK
ncbi:MAG TPA: class I adenylate-forming enzyme family protein [Desulfomonilaceae bacterium]|nr:class I adenylate-forming enzyme family protein [Desulfomonilaceae bacterium]